MLSKWFSMIFQENHGLLWVLSPKAGGLDFIWCPVTVSKATTSSDAKSAEADADKKCESCSQKQGGPLSF